MAQNTVDKKFVLTKKDRLAVAWRSTFHSRIMEL